MRTLIVLLFCVSILSCKKDSSNVTSEQVNTFSFRDKTYTGNGSASWRSNSENFLILDGLDNANSLSELFIYFNSKPTTDGTYITGSSVGGTNRCHVVVGAFASAGLGYETYNDSTGIVNVTIVNGKIKATFSNLPTVYQGSTSAYDRSLSGVILEE